MSRKIKKTIKVVKGELFIYDLNAKQEKIIPYEKVAGDTIELEDGCVQLKDTEFESEEATYTLSQADMIKYGTKVEK